MTKLKPHDKKARQIHKGDWIRIIELPDDMSSMTKESIKIFKKALGNTFKIESFDKYGHIELAVWRKLKLKTFDTIWIEPCHISRSRFMKKYNKSV